jgi:hypothetical protein
VVATPASCETIPCETALDAYPIGASCAGSRSAYGTGRMRRRVPGYGRPVNQGEPWQEYRRARLPGGWTYLIGREVIEQALRDAGASIRSLTLGRPDRLARADVLSIFDVYWYGDARSGSFGPRDERRVLLLMRWTAVPGDVARRIAEEVRQVWLPRGSTWAAEAPKRGNAWSAAEHRWLLVYDDGHLRAVET